MTIEGHGNSNWFPLFDVFSNYLLVTLSRGEGDDESDLRVWDPDDGHLVRSVPTGLKAVRAVLCLSNDQVAVGTGSGAIKIFDLLNDGLTRVNDKAHSRWVTCLLQLSNLNLVSSGADLFSNHSIKLWNFSDLSLLQHIINDHVGTIVSLSISQDETLLASGGQDGTIKLWPIKTDAA